MSVPHPTEQNGQMLGVVLASLIRSSCARAMAGASVTPRPTSPPMAVPAPALAVRRRKSRRPTSIHSSALEMRWVREALQRLPDDIETGLGARNPPNVIILTGPGGPEPVAVESAFSPPGGRAMPGFPAFTHDRFEMLVGRELPKRGLA